MILNAIVALFVLGMAILWSTYGMFSALIQLLLLIAAGAIAFAVWEPLTVGLLLDYIPAYAWAVGLIGPFILALVVMRVATDKLVPGNMQLPRLADQILGAVFGAGAGVVAAGVTLIGLSYLPLPLSMLGYQPFEVRSDARIAPSEGDVTASLWVPADQLTAHLFSYLSTRGFAPHGGRSLAHVHPNLFEEFGTARLGRFYDANSALSAQPEHITVTAAQTFTESLPDQLSDELTSWFTETAPTRAGDQIVTVSTSWEHPKGGATFDGDNILRLPPYQTQLVAEVPGQDGLERYLPVGWSKLSNISTDREFFFVANNQSMASSLLSPGDIVFVYAIPNDAAPKYFQARGIRFELPSDAASNDAAALVAALGAPTTGEGDDGDDEPVVVAVNPEAGSRVSQDVTGGYANHKALGLEQTNAIVRAISPNDATGLSVNEETKLIESGTDTTNKSARGGASSRGIAIAESLRPIRLQIQPTAASQTPLGTVAEGGTTDPEIWIESKNGSKFYAIAFDWMQDKDQTISITDIRRTSDLPLNKYKAGDALYIYFAIPPNTPLAAYHIGDTAYQELTYTVSEDQQRR